MLQCTKSSVKFGGGNVIVSDMISAAGAGPPVRLHGKINLAVCKDMLKKHVVPYLRTAIIQSSVFMEDNGPCHTAKSVKTFLFEEYVTVIELPTQLRHESYWEFLEVT